MKVFSRVSVIILIICTIANISYAAGKPAKDKEMKSKPAGSEIKADTNAPAAAEDAKPAEQAKPAVKEAEGAATQPVIEKPVEKVAAPAVPAPSASATVEVVDSNEPAVTVNGSVITEGEVDARLQLIMDKRSSRMDPNVAAQYKRRLKGQVLDGMITEQLLDEQMKDSGVEVNDNDVNDKISEITIQQNISTEMLKQLMASQGQSYDEFIKQVKRSIGYEKLLAKKTIATDINEARAFEYYEENKESFTKPDRVAASHILIKVAPSATADEKAAAKQKAENLLEKVREKDANFADIARENSDCPSKTEGGNLGLFDRGQMVKEFEDAAFALKPGEISDVVETQFGYHVIKVTDRLPAGVIPFEEIKSEIIKGLTKQEVQKSYRDFIDKLKAEAKIVYPAGKEPAFPVRREIAPRSVEATPGSRPSSPMPPPPTPPK